MRELSMILDFKIPAV